MTDAGEYLIHTVKVDPERGYRFYDEREPVADTIFDDLEGSELRGALYRYGVQEHGRCTGKMYVDTDDGVKHVGYVFVKREQFDRDEETYLCETWLSLERVVAVAQPTIVASVAL